MYINNFGGGRRRPMMAKHSGGGKLPEEYQAVQYIGSGNGQYIQTSVYGNRIDEIHAIINAQSNNNFGAFFGNTNRDDFCFAAYYTNGYYVRLRTSQVFADRDLRFTNPITFDLADNKLSINERTWDVDTSRTISTNGSLMLLFNSGGGANKCEIVKMVFMYQGGIVFNGIPCYRISDSKPGIYDLAGSICPLTDSPFYINAGSSEFIIGPDI